MTFIDYDGLAFTITHRDEHPVMRYVRDLPFESASYPANMYRGLTGQGDGCLGCGSGESGGLITWSPPAHDLERPKRKGCGFIRSKGSKGDDGILYTACSKDKAHFAKGKRSHCWSLACPQCANDTALRNGSRAEERFEAYRILKEKQGRDPGRLGHWVISPEQETMKSMMQTVDGFSDLRKSIERDLQDVGAKAGMLVVHPWRQGEDSWRFSPHFHGIIHGYLDTDSFRDGHPGWVLKKIHADEELRSIGQTVAYLSTHAGLGVAERDVSEVDYDMRFLSWMLPGLTDDDYRSGSPPNGLYGAASGRPFRYSEDDYSRLGEGKGRMAGDLSDMDWLDFAMRPLSYDLRQVYFGELAQRNLRSVSVETEYRTRPCPICGDDLNVYSGMCDLHGEPSGYRAENTFHTFGEHYPLVRDVLKEMESDLRDGGVKLGEVSPEVALIVSRAEATGQIDRGSMPPVGIPLADATDQRDDAGVIG